MYEVSVVIPCHNGATIIEPQLRALAAQADSRTEIVVANNRSTDDIVATVERIAHETGSNIRVVDAHKRQGINHARNVGIRASSGAYVLLCDADDVVHDGWISRMTGPLKAGAGCVGGPMRRQTPAGDIIEHTRGVTTRFWSARGIYVAYATGANCGFLRSVFEDVGGFDEGFAGGSDENEFFIRTSLIGRRPVLAAGAFVNYVQRERLRDAMRQHASYGIGGVRLHRKFAQDGMPRDAWWVPPATVIVSLAACVIGPANRRRIAAERIARRWGRLRGSIHFRHLYL